MLESNSSGDCVKWTLTSGDVTVEITATLDDAGTVSFNYELVSGTADLNGFYLDLDNDGGAIRRLDGGNNMNGSDSDGDKLDGFDFAQVIGTVGGNDADTTSGTVTVSMSDLGITSLAELANAEVGIRATSVGEDREGSLKLAGTGEVCKDDDPGTEITLDFPNCEAGLTSMTLVFLRPDGVAGGDYNLDGYRAVTVEFTPEVPTDADTFINDLIADLMAQDEFLSGDTSILKGAFLYCADDDVDFFYYANFNANGEAPDILPGATINDDGTISPDGAIDVSYAAALDSDGFHFTELTADLIV